MPSPRVLSVALLLLLLLTAGGCSRGPGLPELERELQARLDTGFQKNLFAILDFRRTGSAPFRDIESGVSGVYIYYDAELEFLRDYSLTQWRGLNLGTLAFAIGATEAGVTGFHARGNRRGERMQAQGRLAFTGGDGGEWQPIRNQSADGIDQDVDGSRQLTGRSVDHVLADMRALLARERGQRTSPRGALIVEELDAAVHRIDRALARAEGKITLATGPAAGTYYAFGKALARFGEAQGVAIFSSNSVGSVDNASRLQAGDVDFGLVQSDVAQLMFEGWSSEAFFPNQDLRAVASLWPEAVHLITLRGSNINQLGDLLQRRVAIGRRGSGSRVNAILIGLASDLQPDQVPDIREIDLEKAIEELERGEIDAIFLTAAVPSPAVQALAARRDDVVFVPVAATVLEKMDGQHYAYYPLTVAARSYPGQVEPFTTLGLTAALMTHRGVPDERVEQLLDLLLKGGDDFSRHYYRAAFISRETMRLGLAVPLHPAAERFYRRHEQAERVGATD